MMRLLCATAALGLAWPAAAARDPGSGDGAPDQGAVSERGSAPDPDDARARSEAVRRLREEDDSPEALRRTLLVARRERDRAGVVANHGQAARGQSATSGAGPWVSLGPSHADDDFNAAEYHSIDSGRLRGIVPHPSDPNLLYLATAGGGVWKTFDAGASWEPLTDGLGSLAVGSIALDPANPDILYLGLGDPFDTAQPGLLRSLDGGATFSEPVFPSATYGSQTLLATSVRDLKVDPTDSGHLLIATNVGLFSWDGQGAPVQLALPDRSGASGSAFQLWSIAWVGQGTWLATGRKLDLTHADTPPVDTHLLGLWRSTDNGATWTSDTAGLPASDVNDLGRATLAVAPSTTLDPATARVFLLSSNHDDAGAKQKDVYRSDDGGQTFTGTGCNASGTPVNANSQQPNLDVLAKQAAYNQAIIVDPDNPDIVFVGGQLSMVRTLDGGASWSVMSDWLPAADGIPLPYLHADFHAMAYGPAPAASGGGKMFYVGGDGGLFTSIDAFSAAPGTARINDSLNAGLVTHLAYSLACASENWPAELQGFVIGGLQDNGTRLRAPNSANGPSTFNQVVGGDGVGVAVSRDAVGTIPGAVLASSPFAIYRSTSGGSGNSFLAFNAGITGPLPFFVRLAREDAAADGQTFLTFTDPNDSSLYRSVAGGTWANIDGLVHYPAGNSQGSFIDYASQPISFHDVHAHPKAAGVYGATGTAGSVFSSADGGGNWTAGRVLGTNGGRALGIKGATQISFDPGDNTGAGFLVASNSAFVFDTTSANVKNPPVQAVPDDFGHLFKTTDRGLTWTSVTGGGAIPRGGNVNTQLPNAPIEAVKFDPNDRQTVYVGTWIGLYKSTNGGVDFTRDRGLPLVKVTDICIAPQSTSLKISTYGRGFWQLNLTPGGALAGVRGHGDLDFNQRLDAFDLIDLVAAMGTTNQSAGYRQEADLVGNTNAVDDADLAAFLARFGSAP